MTIAIDLGNEALVKVPSQTRASSKKLSSGESLRGGDLIGSLFRSIGLLGRAHMLGSAEEFAFCEGIDSFLTAD